MAWPGGQPGGAISLGDGDNVIQNSNDNAWFLPTYDFSQNTGPSPDIPPDNNDLEYSTVDNNVIVPPEPSAADRATIAKIIHDYKSFLGVFIGVGRYIEGAMTSSGSNFGYGGFWRLAQNVKPNSYTGALGVVGEGEAAYDSEKSFNGFTTSMFTSEYLYYHSSSQNGSWDFRIDVTAKTSGALQIGYAYTVNGTYYAVTRQMNANDQVQLYYEVKTISPNSDPAKISSYISTGLGQAIENAQKNASTTSTVASILTVDYDAYMVAFNSNPTQFVSLLNQLNSLGGWLHLQKDLFKDSKTAVDELNSLIKNQTSP